VEGEIDVSQKEEPPHRNTTTSWKIGTRRFVQGLTQINVNSCILNNYTQQYGLGSDYGVSRSVEKFLGSWCIPS